MSDSLRGLLEARRDAHYWHLIQDWCVYCGQAWPCADRVALDAALAHLTTIEGLREAYVTSADMCAERMETGYPESQCEGCDTAKLIEAALAVLTGSDQARGSEGT